MTEGLAEGLEEEREEVEKLLANQSVQFSHPPGVNPPPVPYAFLIAPPIEGEAMHCSSISSMKRLGSYLHVHLAPFRIIWAYERVQVLQARSMLQRVCSSSISDLESMARFEMGTGFLPFLLYIRGRTRGPSRRVWS